MTEQDWLTGSAAYAMFLHTCDRGRATDRKLRLFMVACCRRIAAQLVDDRSRAALRVAEQFADGRATPTQLAEAYRAANAARHAILHPRGRPMDAKTAAAFHAAMAACWAASEEDHAAWSAATEATRAARGAVLATAEEGDVVGPERGEQANLLRDLFGNPFREVHIDPAYLTWNNATVRRLAQSAYEEREMPSGHLDRAKLAVLADALEEAGCSDPDLVGHLRSPGPHVRGCHIVDPLLDRR